jgi:hypothetical protein
MKKRTSPRLLAARSSSGAVVGVEASVPQLN